MKKRILELDSIRGLAALFVVLYHYTTRYEQAFGFETAPSFDFSLGHYGVQLFFVVSGYVIFLTITNCRHPLDFISSRFARLYPVYWAALIVTFISITSFGLNDRDLTIYDALINLTMLQGFIGVPDIDSVYWTLKWELVFYFWMLVFFVTRQLSKTYLICVAWLLSQWVVVGIEQFGYQVPGLIKLATLNTYCNLFVAGIIFHLIHIKSDSKFHYVIALALFNQYLVHGLVDFLVTLVIFGTFYLFVYGKLEILVKRPLIFLGTISYSLYLIHQYVGWIVMRKLLSFSIPTDLSIALTVCFVIALASLLTLRVEQPSMKLIRRLYKERIRPSLVKSSET